VGRLRVGSTCFVSLCIWFFTVSSVLMARLPSLGVLFVGRTWQGVSAHRYDDDDDDDDDDDTVVPI